SGLVPYLEDHTHQTSRVAAGGRLRAYFKAKTVIDRDEIAGRQLHALRPFQRSYPCPPVGVDRLERLATGTAHAAAIHSLHRHWGPCLTNTGFARLSSPGQQSVLLPADLGWVER